MVLEKIRVFDSPDIKWQSSFLNCRILWLKSFMPRLLACRCYTLLCICTLQRICNGFKMLTVISVYFVLVVVLNEKKKMAFNCMLCLIITYTYYSNPAHFEFFEHCILRSFLFTCKSFKFYKNII